MAANRRQTVSTPYTMNPLSLLFLVFFLAIVHSSEHGGLPLPIHLLRPKSGCGQHLSRHHINCASWRLAVETNNIRNWRTVPAECEYYLGNYMLGHLYRSDSRVVINEAISYLGSLKLTHDCKNIWIFDIDETTLSNLPYYAKNGFGAKPFNQTEFNKWVALEKAVALPESLKLYEKLLCSGVKIVFITGRLEEQRRATETNLKKAGYHTWDNLVLKGPSAVGKKAVVYKSEEREKLEQQGFRIIGNIGDQWSDILGTNVGDRTFKLPDPMYYIA